jgi:hypothetical protein
MGTPSTAVGPGLGAFVAFFVLAVVLWLLMRNMNGRMRRMAYREQERIAELEAREAERTASRGGATRTAQEKPPPDAAQEPDRADPAP